MALAAAALPLWLCGELPLVDMPQHLHLISVLHRLRDATTLYPELFALRTELTPYVGYYFAAEALSWLMPLEVANRLVVSFCVVALPLSVGSLLRAAGRPRWPSLLVAPLAYGDSFAWGFVNFCLALPFCFWALAAALRLLRGEAAPRRSAVWLSALWLGCFFLHVQVFAFLCAALALIAALYARQIARQGAWKTWFGAALLPLSTALLWVLTRLQSPTEIAPGVPWKARGPIFSKENLEFLSFEQNRAAMFKLLSGLLKDQSDERAVAAVLWCAAVGMGFALFFSVARKQWLADPLLLALGALALLLYFTAPFNIHGYMYSLNQRFVHLAAPLLIAGGVSLPPRFRSLAKSLSLGLVLWHAKTLHVGFQTFDREMASLSTVATQSSPASRTMSLIFDTSSGSMRLPVFLHAGSVLARKSGGISNFSFASTPHSPLKFKTAPPPTFPSEWRPQDFRESMHGATYDQLLIRGAHPVQLLGAGWERRWSLAAQASTWTLLKRRSDR